MIGSLDRSRSLVVPAVFLALMVACASPSPTRRKVSGADPHAPVSAAVGSRADTVTSAGATASAPSYKDGELAFQARRYNVAAEIFTTVAERNPDQLWGQYMLGLASWKAGKLPEAESAFGRALAIDSTHRKSLVNLSRVLLEAGRPKDAEARLEQALAVDSGSAEVLRLLARAKGEQGEVDAAVATYHWALAVDSGDVWAMNNLGHLLLQAGRVQEALPPLARAVELRPGVATFQNNLGNALERGGYNAEAEQAYSAALGADSGYAKAGTGLERVRGRDDVPAFGTLDLTGLATEFEQNRATWAPESVEGTPAGSVEPAELEPSESMPDSASC